jgi:lipoyl(octanoyl) transferase
MGFEIQEVVYQSWCLQMNSFGWVGLALRMGILEYEESLSLQNQLVQARMNDEISDTILFLQHLPVITIGKSGKLENILAPEKIEERNIRVIFTDRGGDITYHGPGQLVVYPIINLRNQGIGLSGYVWKLEETVIQLLSCFGIDGSRVEKMRGVWVGEEKIAALGIHLSRWISKHGLALNVNTDLDPFDLINPCGTGRKATSMARILGRELSMEEVESMMIRSFAEVFGMSISVKSSDRLKACR